MEKPSASNCAKTLKVKYLVVGCVGVALTLYWWGMGIR